MRKFKTESKKLLDLMVNSIYTNKDIFLRELISNASDSLDKLYLQALQSGDKSISRSDLEIMLAINKGERTITISDNGIGMTEDELEKNLGTIAHSGSLEFKEGEEAQQNDEIDIIGQFGVGFYSAFMVADKVQVSTRAYNCDKAYTWTSDGLEGYTIAEGDRKERGTDIVLHLRENFGEGDNVEDFDHYLEQYSIKNLVKRYSDYVRYPIKMNVDKTREKPKPEDAGDDYTPEYEDYVELETLNSMTPIWTRKKSEVTDEEYADFYKAQFHDFADPLLTIPLHAEGTLNYDALIFVPSKVPEAFYTKDFKNGLALYSSSVMITESSEELLPEAFRFVRGVVDSPDLNLNISREMLQKDRQLKAIERRIEKKVKQELKKLLENDREKYEKFFEQFGHALKYAIYSSFGVGSELLADLLLFYSAKEKKLVTLQEYVDSSSEDQTSIFFAAGDTTEHLANSTNVKAVLDKGFDVLLCGMQIDEFTLMSMGKFDEKDLKNVASEDLGLSSDEEKEQAKKVNEDNTDLFKEMKEALPDTVDAVISSTRLSDSAACITASGPVSLSMAKYFASMPNNGEAPKAKYTLEINPKHEIFKTLQKAHKASEQDKVKRYSKLLFDQALLAEGLPIDDPLAFNAAICELMK